MKSRRSIAGLAALALSFAAAVTAAGGTALPAPCQLLKRTEANVLAGIKLEPPIASGASCTYNPVPTGPVAQVFVFVDSSVPITLTTDRRLHHAFRRVPRIGDEALEENGYIFVRKGSVWITLHVLAVDQWPGPRKRLEHAAVLAVSRIATARRLETAWDPGSGSGREHWAGKERLYGDAITRYAGVDYQPDVVLVGGGVDSIRSESPDGLTWTIKRDAPGAAGLRVGKIMLATTFASGRVLKLTPVGPNLRVVLGPVALTDVIRDGFFASSAPIPLGNPIANTTALPVKPPAKRHTLGASATSTASEFSTRALCCSDGIGVNISYDNGEGRLGAAVALVADRPTVSFQIRIGGGRLLDAAFQLHGAARLHYYLFGATLNGAGDVKSGPIEVPGSFTIPLVGPFALTFTQSFDVSMQFAGRATVKATGDYGVSGDLGFRTSGGPPTEEPVSLTTDTPITQNTLSLGVGENAISLGWALRATVGIGVGVLTAGAWADLRTGIALVADGSNLESLKFGCARADIDVTSRYGVGYTLANFVRKIVNAILGAVGAKPIPPSGGPEWGPYTLWHPAQAQWCPPRR